MLRPLLASRNVWFKLPQCGIKSASSSSNSDDIPASVVTVNSTLKTNQLKLQQKVAGDYVSGYALFIKQFYALKEHLKVEEPRTCAKIAPIASEKWSKMSEDEKKIFSEQAKLQNAAILKNFSKLSVEEQQAAISDRKDRKKNRTVINGIDQSKNIKIPHGAGKVLTGFRLFVREFFASDERRVFVRSRGGLKIVAEDWWKLSETERKEIKKRAEKINAEMASELERQEPEEQRAEIFERLKSNKEKLVRRRNMRLTRLKAEYEKPLNPGTTYAIFVRDFWANNSETRSAFKSCVVGSDANKVVRDAWNNLSDVERQKYKEKFRVENAAYKKDLLAWETKMIANNQEDILRELKIRKPLRPANKNLSSSSIQSEIKEEKPTIQRSPRAFYEAHQRVNKPAAE